MKSDCRRKVVNIITHMPWPFLWKLFFLPDLFFLYVVFILPILFNSVRAFVLLLLFGTHAHAAICQLIGHLICPSKCGRSHQELLGGESEEESTGSCQTAPLLRKPHPGRRKTACVPRPWTQEQHKQTFDLRVCELRLWGMWTYSAVATTTCWRLLLSPSFVDKLARLLS